jgi:ATP-binding cassette, subfamily F, member 3
MIVRIKNIEKSYRNKCIFDKAGFVVHKGDKIALTGQNGTGKSTLINCLSGKESFEGVIEVNDSKISIMEQENVFEKEDVSFIEYLKEKQKKASKIKEKIEVQFTDASLYEDDQRFQILSQEYNLVVSSQRDKIEEENIKKILAKLAFEMKDYNKRIIDLSGGQRTKLRIAECLSRPAHLYILDEPTNHIDFQTLKWLEYYLLNKVQTFMVVSHDRFFLKRTVNKVIEIENKVFKQYKCNFVTYLTRRKKYLASLQAKHLSVEKERKRLLDSAKEKRDWAKRSMSKTYRVQAEKLEERAAELPLIPNPKKFMNKFELGFNSNIIPSKQIFVASKVSKSFTNHKVFNQIDFEIFRGDKVGVIGRNGSGKTTLLKILAESINYDSGEIVKGRNLVIGYFDQEFKDIKKDQKVLDFLIHNFAGFPHHELVALAVKFGFPRDKFKSKISVLSGGEKARLNFMRLTLNRCNVLLLDEPTNNLDLELRGVLDKTLKEYNGTIVVVSHDRYFIQNVTNKLLVISEQKVTEHVSKGYF